MLIQFELSFDYFLGLMNLQIYSPEDNCTNEQLT